LNDVPSGPSRDYETNEKQIVRFTLTASDNQKQPSAASWVTFFKANVNSIGAMSRLHVFWVTELQGAESRVPIGATTGIATIKKAAWARVTIHL